MENASKKWNQSVFVQVKQKLRKIVHKNESNLNFTQPRPQIQTNASFVVSTFWSSGKAHMDLFTNM